ncbi:MAG: LysR family transcriptional regulator [Proteobacteria bacterium]|nr:LysR family transcriptional regulator [Pseudomonadota bacterium]
MESLNLRWIETFYWIVRLGSFHAAARHLNATQPGVSARIRELERALGVPLFDRSSRSARLTMKGRELLKYAQRVLAIAADIRENVGQGGALSGLVRLGAADTIALTWLPTLLARLKREHPSLVVDLEVDLTVNLTRGLQQGQIDLAFMVGPVPDPNLVSEPLGNVRLAWMASPRLGLPPDPVPPGVLATFPIISHTRGSHQYAMIQRWFQRHGCEPLRISGCSSLATIIRLSVEGVGIGLLAPATLGGEVAGGALRAVTTSDDLPTNDFVAAYPLNTLEPSAKVISRLAAEVAATDPAFERPWAP